MLILLRSKAIILGGVFLSIPVYYLSKESFEHKKENYHLPDALLGELNIPKQGPWTAVIDAHLLLSVCFFGWHPKKSNWLVKAELQLIVSDSAVFLLVPSIAKEDFNAFIHPLIDTFEKGQLSLSKLPLRLIELAMERNRKVLFDIEKSLSNLEDEIISADTEIMAEKFAKEELSPVTKKKRKKNPYKNYMDRIIHHRKQLFLMYKYIEPLDDAINFFTEINHPLMGEDLSPYVDKLLKKQERLNSLLLQTREYATQVREAWQTQVDIGLNSIMKVFTVMTSIFLPLSLVTGWYGMNFHNMPELQWQYGYPMALGVSALLVILSLMYFKRNKLL